MSKHIQPRNNSILKLLLLGCSLPLLFASPAQAQCSRAEIEANIARLKDIRDLVMLDSHPTFEAVIRCGSHAIAPQRVIVKDKDENLNVRYSVASALGSMEERESKLVDDWRAVVKDKDKDINVRYSAASDLGSMGEKASKAVDDLRAVVKDKDDDPRVREKAAEALRDIGEKASKAVDDLRAVVKDKNDNTDVREMAASALESIGEKASKAVDDLRAVVKDKNDNTDVRWSAASALVSMGEKASEAVDDLRAVVKDKDDDSDVRLGAASALGRMGEKASEAVDDLSAVVKDKNDNLNLRQRAALVLKGMGEKASEAVDDLSAVVKDKDDNLTLRLSAAYALESMGEKASEAVDDLRAVVKDKDDDPRVRLSAAEALGSMGEKASEAVDDLSVVVKDKDDNPDLRLSAAEALERMGEKASEAVDDLSAVVKDKDDNPNLRWSAANALESIGLQLQKNKQKVSTKDLDRFIPSFETALKVLDADKENFSDEKQVENIRAYLNALKTEKERRWLYQILPKLRNGIPIHLAFWITLIFLYPKSPQLQAIFFWNPKIRKLFGLWYIDFALTWVPPLRRRLFSPFLDSLLSDADLESFDPNAYFPNLQVQLKSPPKHLSLPEAIPEIKGEIVLEGESGLGKSMFLKSLVVSSKRIVVYLPAKKCENGVMDAIRAKLHGYVKEDPHFLQNLIYSGAMDICIDGLNEVTPDTRAKITSFVEHYFKGNIILATQPLEWTPPSTSTARIYRLQPLKLEQIKEFLQTRQNFLPENASIVGEDYHRACQNYLEHINTTPQSPEERTAMQRMLSNPMELSIVSQMLSRGEKPDLLNLQQQQYNMMAADYQRIHLQSFPLTKFAETAYEMRLKDESAIPTEWHKELQCLERYKMVISRQFTDIHSKTQQEWYFRHDKIQEFFIVQTFLGEVRDNRLLDYMGDPRFRGVYFLLATMMPVNEARELRETLIQYAADTKDHTVSDTFIQLFRTRQESVVGVR